MKNPFDEFIKKLDDNYKIKFKKLTDENIYEFVISLNDDLQHILDINIREDKYQKTLRNISNLKGRWAKKVILGEYPFLEDNYKLVCIEYEHSRYDVDKLNKFKKYFNVDDPEEYKNNQILKINDWRNHKSYRIIDFPYLDMLSKKMCKTAYKYDILLDFYDYIVKNEKELNETFTAVPSLFSDILVDTTNRNNLFEYNGSDTEENLINNYEPVKALLVDDPSKEGLNATLERDAYLEFFQGKKGDALDDATKFALAKSAKYMNSLDIKTFLYFYNNLKNIITDEPITMSLYALEKELGFTDCSSTKTDELVIGTLSKLANMRLNGSIMGLSNKPISIMGSFLECKVYPKMINNKEVTYIYVKLGGILKDFILQQNVYQYNEKIYNSLSEDTKQIIIWLQKWRYQALINKTELSTEFDIMQNSFGIYWRKARLSRKKGRIVSALEELKSKNIIIDHFTVGTKTIKVYYKTPDNNDFRVLESNGIDIKEISNVIC